MINRPPTSEPVGRRQDTFIAALRSAGAEVEVHPRPSLGDVKESAIFEEVVKMYRALGGALPEPPMRPGPWDLSLSQRVVELDEEQHFNRYRAQTLSSPLYSLLDGFPASDYMSWCAAHEIECVRKASNRGYWSTPSCEMQFGAASVPGILEGPGSPRWKQRAFYDFVKDTSPMTLNLPVSRVSIWQPIEHRGVIRTLGGILDAVSMDNTELTDVGQLLMRAVEGQTFTQLIP